MRKNFSALLIMIAGLDNTSKSTQVESGLTSTIDIGLQTDVKCTIDSEILNDLAVDTERKLRGLDKRRRD